MCIGNGHKQNNQLNPRNLKRHQPYLRSLMPSDKRRAPRPQMPTPLLLCLLLISGCLSIVSDIKAQFLNADEPTGGIRINQIGYGTRDAKIAILDSDLFPGQHRLPFYIIALNQYADTVFSGRLHPTAKDLYAKKIQYLADFSSFTREGHYFLSIPGQGTSYPFTIKQQPYDPVLKAAVKAYYFNRASTALTPAFGGTWSRKEGHPDTLVQVHASASSDTRPKGTIIGAPGGWYDAGDYNKYIVNAGITMNTLLEALNDYPDLFERQQLQIPESGNGLPDLLNELLYNLRWMMHMQDPADGGVYHKLTSARFDGMEMPQKDHAKRYVVQKTTAATLDFAAVMATAARYLPAYQDKLPGLIDSLRQSAVKAWDWALANPEIKYDQDALNKKYRPKISTGAYGDMHLHDEWYQAAASLLLTTKDKRFLPAIRKNTPDHLGLPSWNSVGTIGAIWLAQLKANTFEGQQNWSGKDKQALLAIQQTSRKALLFLADQLLRQTNPGYHTVMGGRKTDFKWGSNSEAANQGWILMEAYQMTKDQKYRAAALDNLDYLLGRNATGYCFVTGFGSLSPRHPHHRISVADGIEDPVPGMLVGGPNPGRQDGVKGYPETGADRPELSYLDKDAAYSVNEIAINWNAPFVYLLAAIEATAPAADTTQ